MTIIYKCFELNGIAIGICIIVIVSAVISCLGTLLVDGEECCIDIAEGIWNDNRTCIIGNNTFIEPLCFVEFPGYYLLFKWKPFYAVGEIKK